MNFKGRNPTFANAKIATATILLAMSSYGEAKPMRQDWRVEPSPLRILAGGDQQIGVERIVRPDDEIMRVAIGIAASAKLSDAIQIQIAGESWTAPSGAYLTGFKIISGPAGMTPNAHTFCGQELRSSGSRQRVKSRVRFCLTDMDADGTLDHAFLVGARNADDAVLRPVAPVAYQYRENVPLPNSNLRVTYYKPPAAAFDFNGRTLVIRPTILGKDWGSLEIIHTRVEGKRKSFKAYQTIGGDIYPRTIEFGGAKISILAFNKETSEVRLKVEQGFENADFDGAYGGSTLLFI